VDVLHEERKRPVAKRIRKVPVQKPTRSSLRDMITGILFSVFDNKYSCHFSLLLMHYILES
jgi:hypothetical protein